MKRVSGNILNDLELTDTLMKDMTNIVSSANLFSIFFN